MGAVTYLPPQPGILSAQLYSFSTTFTSLTLSRNVIQPHHIGSLSSTLPLSSDFLPTKHPCLTIHVWHTCAIAHLRKKCRRISPIANHRVERTENVPFPNSQHLNRNRFSTLQKSDHHDQIVALRSRGPLEICEVKRAVLARDP